MYWLWSVKASSIKVNLSNSCNLWPQYPYQYGTDSGVFPGSPTALSIWFYNHIRPTLRVNREWVVGELCAHSNFYVHSLFSAFDLGISWHFSWENRWAQSTRAEQALCGSGRVPSPMVFWQSDNWGRRREATRAFALNCPPTGSVTSEAIRVGFAHKSA